MINKIVFLNSLALLLLATTFSFAQKTMKDEALIKFEITDIESDNEEIAMVKSMLEGGTMDFYFGKKEMRMDMNMMGGMVQQSIFNNSDKKETWLYMNMMGQKIKSKSEYQEPETNKTGKANVKVDKKSTKTIAGYKCYKVTVKSEDGTGDVVFYCTDKIKVNQAQNEQFRQLDGFPLEWNITTPEMTMVLTAQEVSKLPKNAFEHPKGDYTEMTQEELEEMGAGGGLGF